MAKEKFDFVQPIKDIPTALKGFPKNLVSIIKDPVKNSAEVKARKKEIFPYLYLFSALTLVFILLSLIEVLYFFSSIAFVPALGIALCVFLLMVLKKAAEKFADIECNNCKKVITYGDNVQFKVINKSFSVARESKTIEKNNIPVEATIAAKGKELVTVEVTCKCQECGTEKTFTHTFVSMECNKTGVKVPYVQSGALLVTYEADVKNAYADGLTDIGIDVRPVAGELIVGGKAPSSVKVGNDVYITYNRSAEELVKGYFGNDLQMK